MVSDGTTPIVGRPAFRRFLLVAFFLTGATGLVYQILWARLLVLSFGYTIHSVSIVITAFMGGLALGSALGGFIADRVRSPLAVYAAAEIGVGLIALVTTRSLRGCPSLSLSSVSRCPYPITGSVHGHYLWPWLYSSHRRQAIPGIPSLPVAGGALFL